MATDSFHCSVITPEKAVLECEVSAVVVTAHDGEMGFLPHRAPIVAKLGIGHLRIDESGGSHEYFLDGGFAQMVNNKLTILTEQAKLASDLDRAAAKKALTEAEAMPGGDDLAFKARQDAIQRAKAQLHLAR